MTVTNTSPVIDSFTAEATREVRDGRYYADVTASCSDPDGDAVHLEWDGEYQPDGYVKYTCDVCGNWAQINVPMLTLSAFTLDPAYQDAMTNGVEYSGNAYTVVYNVAPAFRRFVGTNLDNHVCLISQEV